MHWSEHYMLHRRYDNDTYNCGHLIEEVQKEVFEREVDFIVPKESDPYDAILSVINNQRDKVVKVEQPQDGDLVLLYLHGKPVHLGIVWFHGKRLYVLHGMSREKSIVNTEINALLRWGMDVEGYYRPIDKEEEQQHDDAGPLSKSDT